MVDIRSGGRLAKKLRLNSLNTLADCDEEYDGE